MPSTKTIKTSTQLVVEGRDAEVFFRVLLGHIQARDVQVQDFGGTSELAGFLKGAAKHARILDPGFSHSASFGTLKLTQQPPSRVFGALSLPHGCPFRRRPISRPATIHE